MRNILHISLILILLSSCSKYQKVLKSDNYNYKYEKAVMYYDNGDYNRAMPLFNELSTVFKGTSKIQQVSYYYAYCNYSTTTIQVPIEESNNMLNLLIVIYATKHPLTLKR